MSLRRGWGTRAFTVGADIAGDLSAGPEIARMVNHALLKTDAYTKPIIAAVNGDCIGGGLELVLASDIRAAARAVGPAKTTRGNDFPKRKMARIPALPLRDRKFADSLLEGAGFEPSVPRSWERTNGAKSDP